MDPQQDTAVIKTGGGFGDIWMGELKDRTRVAIKAWRGSLIEQCDYKTLKRATREVYFWSKLKHDNIHPLIGVVMFKGHYLGMVSHWMDNGNLHEYLRKNPYTNRHQMSVQVASGLAYMHQCDAVHGDVKACNVLVSSDGVAMLSDFGLSTISEAGLAFTETTSTQARSLRWAAPELLLEGSRSSKASDVYALGMTFLEIFSGTVPYPQCRTDLQVLLKLQQGIIPTRPTDHFKDNERGNQMWELLKSCWEREPNDRPGAKEVLESLSSISPVEVRQFFGDTRPDGELPAREHYNSTKAYLSHAQDTRGPKNSERLQQTSVKPEFPSSSTWAEDRWQDSSSKRIENKPIDIHLTPANTDSEMTCQSLTPDGPRPNDAFLNVHSQDDTTMHDGSLGIELENHHTSTLGEKQKRDIVQISGSGDGILGQAKNLSVSVRESEDDGLVPAVSTCVEDSEGPDDGSESGSDDHKPAPRSSRHVGGLENKRVEGVSYWFDQPEDRLFPKDNDIDDTLTRVDGYTYARRNVSSAPEYLPAELHPDSYSMQAMTGRESPEAPQPPLFPDLFPALPILSKWKQDVAQAQHDAERARPVKKPSKEERRRCPECNKLFRRPSSLDDHLNVHSGQKPHECPFTGCNTRFATKSNMKRHFVAHKVGPLERYIREKRLKPENPVCQNGLN